MPAGHPKKFKNGNELIELYSKFCLQIKENGFNEIPSQTNFCEWLKENYGNADRKTIYNSLNKYFPTIKKQFEEIQSSLIAEGAMLGKYKETMSIFVLKNWCKWKDKFEEETGNDTVINIVLPGEDEYRD